MLKLVLKRFVAGIGTGNTTYYAIALQGGAEFEVGLGTVAAGTLARTTIISSSNSDSASRLFSRYKRCILYIASEQSGV